MVDCRQCRLPVVPRPDGTCPSCGQLVIDVAQFLPEADQEEQAKAPVTPFVGLPPREEYVAEARDDFGGISDPPETLRVMAQFYRLLVGLTPFTWATHGFVLINVVVFLIMVATGVNLLTPQTETILDWGANYGPKTLGGQPWRLATSMFLHFGVIHLGFNMWVLWNVGHLVERLVGNIGFIVLYVLSGLFGSLVSLWWHPLSVSAGASGAVFGVFGILLGFLLLRRDSVPPAVLRPLQKSGLSFLGINVVFGMMIPAIDMAAHLGGFVGGFLGGLVVSQRLDEGTVSRRWVRNPLVLASGMVLIGILWTTLPDAPVDLNAELRKLSITEEKVWAAYNRASRAADEGTMETDELVRVIEQDVLLPWSRARNRFEELSFPAEANARLVAQLRKYLLNRQQAWQSQVKYLRSGSDQDLVEFERYSSAADGIAEDMNAKDRGARRR